MTRSQAVALGLVVANAVIAFALLPQSDVVIPPLLKFFLGAGSVGISTTLAFLKIQPAPPALVVPGGGKPIGGDGQ